MRSLRNFFSYWLNKWWYRTISPAFFFFFLILFPFSLIFSAASYVRRKVFQYRLFKVIHLPIPVVTIGNLTVGGTGKTPLTMALAKEMVHLGYHVGIISRGYGGKTKRPIEVNLDSRVGEVGDESILLATVGCPVFVCRDRVAAGQALLKQYPQTDLMLCDDGLQHYRLHRVVEICLIDGQRGWGNGLMLPAGPLREPLCRLKHTDAVVINSPTGEDGVVVSHPFLFRMSLVPGLFRNLRRPEQVCSAQDFNQYPIAALCGIGNPDRFFQTLDQLGLQFDAYHFPDHHVFQRDDLPDAAIILVTEKDAVKLVQLSYLEQMGDRIWVLPVRAVVLPELATWLDKRLKHEF